MPAFGAAALAAPFRLPSDLLSAGIWKQVASGPLLPCGLSEYVSAVNFRLLSHGHQQFLGGSLRIIVLRLGLHIAVVAVDGDDFLTLVCVADVDERLGDGCLEAFVHNRRGLAYADGIVVDAERNADDVGLVPDRGFSANAFSASRKRKSGSPECKCVIII